MKVDFIKVTINNLKLKEVKLKLPIKNTDLQKILLKNEITRLDRSSVQDFDNPLKSVRDIEIRNFKIKEPTNIYYLNSYLDIVKEKDLELPNDHIEITTIKLKEMIAELLNSDNKDMNFEEIYKIINNKTINTKTTKKPKFSIKELQKRYIERKEK